MKTLSKFYINPEKVLKEDSLENLKGGELHFFNCNVWDADYLIDFHVFIGESEWDAEQTCAPIERFNHNRPNIYCDCWPTY